jgi:hypothetical protein
MENIVFGPIFEEDLAIGDGAVAVGLPDGSTQTLHKIGMHTFTGILNVKEFGAMGDGITDDYAAIIAAYNAVSPGGTLYFPGNSTYRISQPWTLTRSNVKILAADPTAILQYVGGVTTYVVGDDGTSSVLYFNNEISNLTIRGNANVQNGLQITSQHHSKFLNLRIQNVASTGMLVKFAVGNQYDVRVSNNDCPGNNYTVQPAVGIDFAGLDVNHAATGSEAYLIVESVSGSGIKMGFTDFMTLRGFSESNNRGLEIYQQTFNLSVISMDFESNATEDVLLNGIGYSQFIGINSTNKFNFNQGRGIALIGGQFKDIVIGVLGLNAYLTGQLIYIGTITDNQPDLTVRSPLIRFTPGPDTFSYENRFYGDSVDVNNRLNAPTLLRVRASAAQAGAAVFKVTDDIASTEFAKIFPSGAIQSGQDAVARTILQPGSPGLMGAVDFYLGGTHYASLGGGAAGNFPLTLFNGAKFGIGLGLTGEWSNTIAYIASWNPANVVNGSQITATFNVPNVVLGDTVTPSFDLDLQGMQLTGYVSSPGVVTVVLRNGTGGDIDLAIGNLRLDIWQH